MAMATGSVSWWASLSEVSSTAFLLSQHVPLGHPEEVNWRWASVGRDCESVIIRDPSDSLLSLSVPVSHPVLTLSAPGAQVVLGDVVELHCEVWRGSSPILYQFYHENVALGSSSAPSGGGLTFNLSLTAEHYGNYYCEANNDLVAQRSEVVPLNIISIAHAVELLRSMSLSQHSGRVLLTPQSFWWCATQDEASMGSPVLGDISEGAWGTPKLVPLFSQQCDKLQVPRCIVSPTSPTPPGRADLSSTHTQDICSPNPSPSPWQLMYRSLPSVPTEDRKEVLTSGVMEVLLGISGPTTIALLFCCWLKRKIGLYL